MRKQKYSIHYKLNGEEQFDLIEADSCPPGVPDEVFNQSLSMCLRKVLGYDDSMGELEILDSEIINQQNNRYEK